MGGVKSVNGRWSWVNVQRGIGFYGGGERSGVPCQATGMGSQRRKYYDLFPSSLKTFSYSPANISSFSEARRS